MISFSKSNGSNPTEIVPAFLAITSIFIAIFAYCEFGEQVMHQFNLYGETFCSCDWYLFPIEMQRIYSIALVGVQDPVIVQGYANTVCTRDAFKNVCFFVF